MSQSSQVFPAGTIKNGVSKLRLGLIIFTGSGLVLVIFSLLLYQLYFLNRVYFGVSINQQNVSTFSPAQVRQVVTHESRDLLARPITLVSDEGNFTVTAAELGSTVDIEQTVKLAFRAGRQGDFFSDLQTQWQIARQPVSIMPVIKFTTGPANNVLLNLAGSLNRPAQNARLILHPDLKIEVIPAQTGKTIDIEAGREAIRRAVFQRKPAAVPLVIHTTPPDIADVEPARQQVETWLSQPLRLTFQEKVWTLEPEILAEWLVFTPQPSTGQMAVSINKTTLEPYFNNLAQQIYQPSRNAWFHLEPESETLIPILESKNSYRLDVATAIEQTSRLLATPNQHQLDLPVIIDPPAVPMDNPQQLGLTTLVTEATSYFKGSSEERLQNIQVAASKFHGLVIPPGEVFSFNEHLGEVTARHGFVESLVIQGDRTAVGIGGGICQVSTTVFRAAFYGGYELVERWAHGYRVGWYETGSVPGLDATIYSPLVDFKFRNDTETYLLIQTHTDLEAGTLTFRFYGTPYRRTIIVSEPVEENFIAHGPDIYQEDATLKPGQIKQLEWAKDGVDITIYRTVKAGETVLHQDTIFSRYKPWQNIYKIGPS